MVTVREAIVQRRLGKGTACRLRGRLMSTVRPLSASTLATSDAVRPESDDAGQRHRPAARRCSSRVSRLGPPAGEDGRGQLMLRRCHGCNRDKATKHGEGYRQGDGQENNPSPVALFARVCKPPGIHDEHNPSQTENDNPDLECSERGSQRGMMRPVQPSAG